nr:PaaI family thioesterase [Skermania piniformis]
MQAADTGPDFGPFIEAMRTLQDLAVSVDAPDEVYGAALSHAQAMIDLLDPYRAPEGESPAGRVLDLPGRGSLLMVPWQVEYFGPDLVRSRGSFRRYHVGGNNAVHGGVIPLLFDEMFGFTSFMAKRSVSRTGYLHVNYRKVTPIDTPLVVESRVDRIEGRKTFVVAELRDEDGTLLADAEGLMIKLLPGQP